MQLARVLSSSLFVVAAFAEIVSVDVGEDGLVFEPDTITAAPGDQVQFSFYPKNHSVIQAAFDSPCIPLDGGIFSGFVPVDSGESDEVFAVDIADTNPIWIYCGQSQHCESGMVAVINPPSSGEDLDTFKENAKSAEASVPSGDVSGGSFISPGSGDSSSSIATDPATDIITVTTISNATSTVTGNLTVTAIGNATSTVSGTATGGTATGTATVVAPTSTPASPTATGAAAAIVAEKAGAMVPILLLAGLLL